MKDWRTNKYRQFRCRYGLEPEQYHQLFVDQDYKCAVCGEEKSYKLYVDHNHRTGKVRALLCARCNTIAGAIEDVKFETVLNYLEFHNGTNT